jgi:acyl-CoA thioester hydrolase
LVVSEHRIKRRVQFYETDAAGIVHFSWFFRYMEEAEHALWREAGLSIHPPGADIGWPRIAASFDFHRALAFEEEFEIWLRITDMTRQTIGYSCLVLRDDRKIASGTMRIACVRRQANQRMHAIDIPADVAARFQVAAETGT